MDMMITYPLNNIEYSAEDAELFHCTRTSGVWAKDSFSASVTGEDRNITVDKGVAWIQNTEFSGKVVAMKSYTVLDLGLSDDLDDRIDVVAIQFSANENETKLIVKHGDPVLTNPQIPQIQRNAGIYELYLCSIYRQAGKTAVTAADVTDLRLNEEYCGLMADSVTRIDTAMIEAQVSELIEVLKSQIGDVSFTAGNVTYDNSTSGSGSANVQDALDEVFEISEKKLDADEIIDVSHGGTGRATLTSGYFLKGNGTSAISMQSASAALSSMGGQKQMSFATASTTTGSIAGGADIPLRTYVESDSGGVFTNSRYSSSYGYGIKCAKAGKYLISAHANLRAEAQGTSPTLAIRKVVSGTSTYIAKAIATTTSVSFAMTLSISPFVAELEANSFLSLYQSLSNVITKEEGCWLTAVFLGE